MSIALPSANACCKPCASPEIVDIPGSPAEPGQDGQDGLNGINAFTLTQGIFVMPAELANVTVSVGDSTWMGVGEPLFIEVAGTLQVVSKPNDVSVTLKNLADTPNLKYPGNAAPTTVIATNSIVTPTGFQGAASAVGGNAGNGSPEGVLTASPGATYTDVSTDPPKFWTKYIGTGNTGWRQLIGLVVFLLSLLQMLAQPILRTPFTTNTPAATTNLVNAMAVNQIMASFNNPFYTPLFWDDFRRTNCSDTNLTPSWSGHRYHYSYANAAGVSNWKTNFVVTNGTATVNSGNNYPGTGGGFFYLGNAITNGPVNFYTANCHFIPSTNSASAFRWAGALIVQDTQLFDDAGNNTFNSNFVHAAFFIGPSGTELDLQSGTVGNAGLNLRNISTRTDLTTLHGPFYFNSNQFQVSLWWSAHNTIVFRVGDSVVTGTAPWLDACRGTNFIFEWAVDGGFTNFVVGQTYLHSWSAGWVPTITELFPTFTTNIVTVPANGSYTNLYSDTKFGVPNGAAVTNRTVRLMPAALMAGKELVVYDQGNTADGTNVLVLANGSELLNGIVTSTNITSKGGSLTLYSDGVTWRILSRF